MTTTRPPARYRDHTLIGTPHQIRNVLRNHAAAGTLIAAGPPQPLSGTDPRIRVRLRLVDPTTPASASPVRPRTTGRLRRVAALTAGVSLAIAAVIAMAAYLIGRLIGFLVDHAATLVGVLVVAAILAAFLTHTSGRRRHCPGC
jgi:VIT1/CCC1 family predicted Fe2+/Mn2+ transporter